MSVLKEHKTQVNEKRTTQGAEWVLDGATISDVLIEGMKPLSGAKNWVQRAFACTAQIRFLRWRAWPRWIASITVAQARCLTVCNNTWLVFIRLNFMKEICHHLFFCDVLNSFFICYLFSTSITFRCVAFSKEKYNFHVNFTLFISKVNKDINKTK